MNQLIITIITNVSQFVNGLNTANRNLNRFVDSVRMAGTHMTTMGRSATAFGAALGASLIAVLKPATQFERQMSFIAAVTEGATNSAGKLTETFGMLRNKAIEIGQTTQFSANQAAEGMRALSLAGLNAEQVYSAVGPTLRLAAFEAVNVGEASEIVADALNAFSTAASNATRVIDSLILAATESNSTILQLGYSLSFVSPVSAALGLSVEETNAALSALANAGIKGSTAGTGLSRILTVLAKRGKEAAQIFSSYGLTLDELDPTINNLTDILNRLAAANISIADLFKIFDLRGGRIVTALMNQITAYNRLVDVQEGSYGESLKRINIVQQNFEVLIIRIINNLKNLAITIYGEADTVGTLANTVKNIAVEWLIWLQNMQHWAEVNKVAIGEWVLWLGKLSAGTATIGVLLVVLGQLVNAIGILGKGVIFVTTALTGMIQVLIANTAAITAFIQRGLALFTVLTSIQVLAQSIVILLGILAIKWLSTFKQSNALKLHVEALKEINRLSEEATKRVDAFNSKFGTTIQKVGELLDLMNQGPRGRLLKDIERMVQLFDELGGFEGMGLEDVRVNAQQEIDKIEKARFQRRLDFINLTRREFLGEEHYPKLELSEELRKRAQIAIEAEKTDFYIQGEKDALLSLNSSLDEMNRKIKNRNDLLKMFPELKEMLPEGAEWIKREKDFLKVVAAGEAAEARLGDAKKATAKLTKDLEEDALDGIAKERFMASRNVEERFEAFAEEKKYRQDIIDMVDATIRRTEDEIEVAKKAIAFFKETKPEKWEKEVTARERAIKNAEELIAGLRDKQIEAADDLNNLVSQLPKYYALALVQLSKVVEKSAEYKHAEEAIKKLHDDWAKRRVEGVEREGVEIDQETARQEQAIANYEKEIRLSIDRLKIEQDGLEVLSRQAEEDGQSLAQQEIAIKYAENLRQQEEQKNKLKQIGATYEEKTLDAIKREHDKNKEYLDKQKKAIDEIDKERERLHLKTLEGLEKELVELQNTFKEEQRIGKERRENLETAIKDLEEAKKRNQEKIKEAEASGSQVAIEETLVEQGTLQKAIDEARAKIVQSIVDEKKREELLVKATAKATEDLLEKEREGLRDLEIANARLREDKLMGAKLEAQKILEIERKKNKDILRDAEAARKAGDTAKAQELETIAQRRMQIARSNARIEEAKAIDEFLKSRKESVNIEKDAGQELAKQVRSVQDLLMLQAALITMENIREQRAIQGMRTIIALEERLIRLQARQAAGAPGLGRNIRVTQAQLGLARQLQAARMRAGGLAIPGMDFAGGAAIGVQVGGGIAHGIAQGIQQGAPAIAQEVQQAVGVSSTGAVPIPVQPIPIPGQARAPINPVFPDAVPAPPGVAEERARRVAAAQQRAQEIRARRLGVFAGLEAEGEQAIQEMPALMAEVQRLTQVAWQQQWGDFFSDEGIWQREWGNFFDNLQGPAIAAGQNVAQNIANGLLAAEPLLLQTAQRIANNLLTTLNVSGAVPTAMGGGGAVASAIASAVGGGMAAGTINDNRSMNMNVNNYVDAQTVQRHIGNALSGAMRYAGRL